MSYKYFVEIGGFIIIKDCVNTHLTVKNPIPKHILDLFLSEIGAPFYHYFTELYYIIDLNNMSIYLKIYTYPYFYSENPKFILDFCRLICCDKKLYTEYL